jgi:cell division cycle protein 20 (cofactor of APC complex)
MNFDLVNHALSYQEVNRCETPPQQARSTPAAVTPQQKEFRRYVKSTMFGVSLNQLNDDGELKSLLSFGSSHDDDEHPSLPDSPYSHDIVVPLHQQTRLNQAKPTRRIPQAPLKSLVIPDLRDDFYLNLMSWSQDGILAIGLDNAVYILVCHTGQVNLLMELGADDNFVTSVSWCTSPGQSNYLAIGTHTSGIELWDAKSCRQVRTLSVARRNRVTSLAWNDSHWLSSGGSDSVILQHDLRMPNGYASEYFGHTDVVCGLAWNANGSKLASGSKDETVCIWDVAMSARRESLSGATPQHVFSEHKSCVKALAWCPFRESVLASGGGIDDKTIKLWNVQTGALLDSVFTGSQVTSLQWSKLYPELLSSHGYPGNQLMLWKYPKMTKMQTFQAHRGRILHMAMSPDGRTAVTAGVDEVLSFWDIAGDTGVAKSTKMSFLPTDFVLPGTPTIR